MTDVLAPTAAPAEVVALGVADRIHPLCPSLPLTQEVA